MRPDEFELGFVRLTVYMKPDIAEVGRVLQVLVRQPLRIGLVNADITPFDVREITGLGVIREPVMRLLIEGAADVPQDVERTTRAVNRLVAVFKVVVAQPSVGADPDEGTRRGR